MSNRCAENSSLPTVRVFMARAVDAVKTVANPVTEREHEYRRIVTLCAPSAVLALATGLCPLSEVVRISVPTAQYRSVEFSLDTYATLFGDSYYRRVVLDSPWLITGTIPVSVGLAVPIAHALEKYDFPGEDLLVTLVSFPISLPDIVAAFMILILFGNNGVVTAVVVALTGNRPTNLTFAVSVSGLFIALVYSMVLRATLILHGTYAEVDLTVEEVAQAPGATSFETLQYVTLPQIRPGIIGALILTFWTGLAIFGALVVIQALVVWTLQFSWELGVGYDVQVAGAMAAVHFTFMFLFTVLGLRYTSVEASA